jgi:integrase
MRKTLTDRAIAALKAKAKRYTVTDPDLPGHYVRCTPAGAKSFVVVAPNPRTRKQVWAVIGSTDTLTIADARERARQAIQRIKDGLPAFEVPPVPPESFEHVADRWLKRHVHAKKLRSEPEITRLLKSHVYPAWGRRAFLDIRRSDVAALLDEVEDDHGGPQADLVLAYVRGVMSWYAARHDDYVPPIVKGMRRTSPKERARSRILSDAELQALWPATEDGGTFSAFIRLLLLTAQRRAKVLSMRWQDIDADGTWRIPREAREKGAPAELVLPPAARAIIEAQPRMASNPYVFAGRGTAAMGAIGKRTEALKAKLPQDMPAFVLHDLRRTARSLMSRAGVLSEHAERTLGHSIGGVEGIYDRHQYRDEIGKALAKLAGLIDRIVHPAENVVPMPKRG